MSFRTLLVLTLTACVALDRTAFTSLAEPVADVSPVAVLFDTGTASATPLAPESLATKKGWAAVGEDNLAHIFTGDAVFMNDRVAVVLRINGKSVEMYSRAADGFTQRATLHPLGIDGAAGTLGRLKIIENSQAAVMIQADVKTEPGAAASFRFRLNAGEATLEARGGQGAGRLRVVDHARYVVVPDFFADDVVFDATTPLARVGLPAENSMLGLTDEGRAIVACVWPSSRQNADLMLAGEWAKRAIASYEIDLRESERLWIAVMEGAGVWHASYVPDPKTPSTPSIGSKEQGPELGFEWKPPMPARWRADFVAGDGATASTSIADAETAAATPRASNQPQCRFDAGRALVRLPDSAGPTSAPSSTTIVIYPIDRTRTTPLTAFCLVDIMRNALGVGPCQYVLDAERIGSADNSTPEPVTQWVEKQFEKKPSKRDADAIRDQLTKMTAQVKRTDARIGDYILFGRKMKQVCEYQAKSRENALMASRFLMIAQTMTSPFEPSATTVDKLAADVVAQAEQADALTKTQASIAALRSAGAAQDYALAKLRMAARRLKQEARTVAAVDPKAAAFAAKVQREAEQMLVKK